MRVLHISPTSYTAISDGELDSLVYAITSAYPLCGEKCLVDLEVRYYMFRDRVRDSLHRVDLTGVERRRRVLHRRE